MQEEATELIGLQVYTPNGIFLGTVNNLVIDIENKKVDGLFISETNPLLVEESKAVNVPYRWIQSVGDVVLLKYFPKRVAAGKKAAAKAPAKPAAEESD
ncbi:MAG: PRC-barrel domain protein [Methanomassiliicoccales archaeon PtaU1.Bin124]|nr:MAG: PRC-barrel domain protein [Methanomassiliicoccales archaeon PtaU1.Bin124]